MIEHTLSIAIGTAATLLAIFLLSLRLQVGGRRIVLDLIRRWVVADVRSSTLALALIAAIAGVAFSSVPASESIEIAGASAPATGQATAENAAADPEMAALRAYVEKTGAAPQTAAIGSTASASPELADVETMIGKLVARLQKDPNDVRGWKMLGWSLLNTGRTDEAAQAYEAALKLDPSDMEVKKALEAARSGQAAPDQTAATNPPASGEGQPGETDTSMIRSMVEGLDQRLATSPKDEAGWLMLMRSRVMLGEPDAAKSALTRAQKAFAGDAAAVARLTAGASELGIEGE